MLLNPYTGRITLNGPSPPFTINRRHSKVPCRGNINRSLQINKDMAEDTLYGFHQENGKVTELLCRSKKTDSLDYEKTL